MAISNRLCNATTFWAEIPWDKGVVIQIPPDGMIELPYHQMEDFLETKPGYEEVKLLMDTLGLFIADPTKDYDEQALKALQACIKARTDQYTASATILRSERAAAGVHDTEESITENLRRLGLVTFKEKTDALVEREKIYSGLLGTRAEAQKGKPKSFNPELTVILTSGMPKEFPTKIAKKLFMLEHPEDVQEDPAAPVAPPSPKKVVRSNVDHGQPTG